MKRKLKSDSSPVIGAWRNRIIGEADVNPAVLVANPGNWRVHGDQQQAALESVLDKVGWVGRVMVNKRTGLIVDGHMRVASALKRGEKKVPVSYVDLDAAEEAAVLATLDPIAAMAGVDADKLGALLAEVEKMLPSTAAAIGALHPVVVAPEQFAEVDENIETEHQCPKCGYAWSGGKMVEEA